VTHWRGPHTGSQVCQTTRWIEKEDAKQTEMMLYCNMMNEFYARLQPSPPAFDRGRARAAQSLLSHLEELSKCDPAIKSTGLACSDLRQQEQVYLVMHESTSVQR